MIKKILVVAAHPDDEILGCGGTVAKMVKGGCRAYSLILGEGITSRDAKRDRNKRASDIAELKVQIRKANRLIGVKEVFIHDFPDNRFDSIPLLEIVKVIERMKNRIRPDIIFTHYSKDLNIDHCLTYRAVITATRPVRGETVKEIYSFEVPSSTEWDYPLSFSPEVFFDIKDSLNIKLKALKEYETELRTFPHPRSSEGIKLNARYRGIGVGLKYAEAFKSVRCIKQRF